MPTPASHNQPAYSVSEISGALKRVVEDTFGYVRVRGEISGFKRAASGHLYLDLKDEKSVLNAVCWKGTAARLGFKPEDGLEVICTGKLTTYAARSNYQLVIESMEIAGEGALMALLEKRKKQLAAEGLFDPARKQELPFLPEVIGVVTSPTGAVIRDILHRITERFPVHVIVWPVLVQGEGAAEQIAAAIEGFNNFDCAPCAPTGLPSLHFEGQEARIERSHEPQISEASPIAERRSAEQGQIIRKPDLLIVARGGGSLEDLWAFNEELVVRAAAASHIPLISAVGHETDTTLIDYAADKRAPTPTAAAEMAVPVRAELLAWVKEQDGRLYKAVAQQLVRRAEKIDGLARGLPRPEALLAQSMQKLDERSERLLLSLPRFLERKTERLEKTALRLNTRNLLQRLEQVETKLTHLTHRATAAMTHRIEREQRQLASAERLLDSLNYRQVLKRGYAIVKGAEGHVVTSAEQAKGKLTLVFHDGEASAQTGSAQGSLF